MEQFRFKVNLGGMIEILSEHLYSSPDVYIRELLQNGVDAIVAREKADEAYKKEKNGELRIRLENEQRLVFEDNGLGLTREEIHKFLAIIGQSSKRDIETGEIFSDYIGRFGIGLLSYFMVSDRICLRTRSANSESGYEWIGNPDGTYTLIEIEKDTIGTEIHIAAKEGCECYFNVSKVEALLMHYGMILPYPIFFEDGIQKKRLNPVYLPWENKEATRDELMQFGQIIFKQQFMDCITFSSERSGVSGVAYILPYSVQPSAKQKHLIYLKNMLLTENGKDILPDWAVFTKCIINAKNLRPTASREGFYIDELLEETRSDIALCIAQHLKDMATENKSSYRRFLDIHSLAVRSIAVENDELYQFFIDDLEFVTTKGLMTGFELRMSQEVLMYAEGDEYRQLSQIFVSQGRLLIDASYVYTKELLYKMQRFYPVEVTTVEADKIEDMLKEISLEDAERAFDFVRCAKRILSEYQCDVEMKQFIPANLPAFYYISNEAKLYQQIQRIQEDSNNIFMDMLSNFATEIETKSAVLYFNLRNSLVKKMIEVKKVEELEDMILVLYIQTLLLGGFPLRNNEMGIMNERLIRLLDKVLH